VYPNADRAGVDDFILISGGVQTRRCRARLTKTRIMIRLDNDEDYPCVDVGDGQRRQVNQVDIEYRFSRETGGLAPGYDFETEVRLDLDSLEPM